MSRLLALELKGVSSAETCDPRLFSRDPNEGCVEALFDRCAELPEEMLPG